MSHREHQCWEQSVLVHKLLSYYRLCENEQESCPLCSQGLNSDEETKHT